MAITVSGITTELSSLLSDLASKATGVDLGALPFVGSVASPVGNAVFGVLQSQIDQALAEVPDDAAAIAAALDGLDAITATVTAAGDIGIRITTSTRTDLASTPFDLGAAVGPVGLDIGGNFDLDFFSDLDVALRFDAVTGQISIEDAGAPELKVGIDAGLSLDAGGKLGVFDIKVADRDPASPELSFFTTLDLPSGDAENVGGALALEVQGRAGLDLMIETTTPASLLPSISTNLVMEFATGSSTPTIAFNDVTLDLGEFFEIFKGTFSDVSAVLNTQPLGKLLDLVTGPVPVVNGLAQKTGLTNFLDVLPSQLNDGVVSLVDLAILKHTLLGGNAVAPNLQDSTAFFDGLSTIDLVRNLTGQAATGSIVLGDIVLSGDAANPDKIFTGLGGPQALAQLDSFVRDAGLLGDIIGPLKEQLAESFSKNSGLSIPLLDDPSKIVELLFSSDKPFTLVEFTLPPLDIHEKEEVFFSVAGPLGLLLGGRIDIDAGLTVGYDTKGLFGTTPNFEGGLYLSTLELNGSPTGYAPVFKVGTALDAGAALRAVVINASITGGIDSDVVGYLEVGALGTPDAGRLRLSDFAGSGCFFDVLTGRFGSNIRIEIEVGFDPFSFTQRIPIANSTIADFNSFACTPTDGILSPDGKGLATLGAATFPATALVLNTGDRAALREFVIGDRPNLVGTDVAEDYDIRLAFDANGAVIVGALDIAGMGVTQRFGSTANPIFSIEGNLGEGDDSLLIRSDVLNDSVVRGGNGADFMQGGAGRDNFAGEAGNDILIGGAGDDTLDGGADRDDLDGGAGADSLNGGDGRDKVTYENADVTGGAGVTLFAQGGKLIGFGGEAEGDVLESIEYIVGTNLSDQLVASAAGDGDIRTLEGRDGADLLEGTDTTRDFLLGGRGADFLNGKGGQDGTSYLASDAGVRIDMERNTFAGGDAEGDILVSIEAVQGSGFGDIIFGNSADNVIDGFLDNDTLYGGTGRDKVSGGVGDDIVFAIGDGDTLDGGGLLSEPGIDLLSYRFVQGGTGVTVDLKTGDGGGNDAIAMAKFTPDGSPLANYSSFENLEGTDFADTLRGDSSDNRIDGRSGNDSLLGDGGNDTLIGGIGADRLDGGFGIDLADYRTAGGRVTVNLATGTGLGSDAQGDVLSTIENLRGSDFSDNLVGDNGDNVIDPGFGEAGVIENVQGGGGTDTLVIDYSDARGGAGKGLVGGFFVGSGQLGSFFREEASSATAQDSVLFAEIEKLRVTGTAFADEVYGGAGDDIIATGSGNDTIVAGSGYDVVQAGTGDDIVSYGTNLDRQLNAFAAPAVFFLDGGRGIDTLSISLAGVTSDVDLQGSAPGIENSGANYKGGGAAIVGFEILRDVFTGAGSDIVVQLGRYDNVIKTGDGSDVIISGLGRDVVDGGNDTAGLFLPVSDGAPVATITDAAAFYGSSGDALVLDYSSLAAGARVTSTMTSVASGIRFRDAAGQTDLLATNGGTYESSDGDSVEIAGVERLYVTGSEAGDVLTGTHIAVAAPLGSGIASIKGDDILRGKGGNDLILGFTGDDLIEGGDGDDILFGTDYDVSSDVRPSQVDTTEIDTLSGGEGADAFVIGTAFYSYYSNDGAATTNHAVITDFAAAAGDTVHFNGTAANYRTEVDAGGMTLIYRIFPGSGDDLVAKVQNVANFDLNAAYVKYNTVAFLPAPDAIAPAAAFASAAPTNQIAATEVPAAARSSAGGFSVTQTASSADLLAGLGSISGVSNVRLTIDGSAEATGVFDGDPFGLGSGIVISTGRAEDLVGPNTQGGLTAPSRTVKLKFESIGVSGDGSEIFKADLSGLGIDLRSITIGDSGLRVGGGGGIASGFDLDAIALSTTNLMSVGLANDLDAELASTRLDVFDFSAAGITHKPGSQREPSNGFPTGENLFGSLNGIVLPFVKLDTFEATGLSLGDGGSVGFDLTRAVSTNGPLYLYIAETGAFGETATAELNVSSAPIKPPGDLSTDLGAPGVAGDTTKLTYSFTPDAGLNQIQFQFVVFTEELPEFSGAALADIFHIRINGIDFASLSDGATLTIDNMQASPSSPVHGDVILNAPGSGPASALIRADAYTRVLTINAPVRAGVENVIEVEVSDTRDAFLDSGILIKGGSIVASAGTAFPNVVLDSPFIEPVLPPAATVSFDLVSHTASSLTTSSNQSSLGNVQVSADGSTVVFANYGSNLVNGFIDSDISDPDIYAFDVATGAVKLVSHAAASSTQSGNNVSIPEPVISSNGTRIVTYSNATDLVAGFVDGNSDTRDSDIYLFDTATGQNKLVSHSFTSQTTTANGTSLPGGNTQFQISADGAYVLFNSIATNLVSGFVDANAGNPDVYLYAAATGTVSLVSHQTNNLAGGANQSVGALLSNDGRFIVLNSNASNLSPQFSGSGANSFFYDTVSNSATLISHTANTLNILTHGAAGVGSLTEGAGGGSALAISADSSTVVFGGLGNGNLFLYDVATATSRYATHSAGDDLVIANGTVRFVALSDDGDHMLYRSSATNLVSGFVDPRNQERLFIYDRQTDTSRLVTHAAGNSSAAINAGDGSAAISSDGRFVLFETGASNVVDGFVDGNPNFSDHYLYDVATGTSRLISHAAGSTTISGNGGDQPADHQISADGEYVLFLSRSSDLVVGPTYTAGWSNWFLYETATGNITLLSQDSAGIANDGTFYYFFEFSPQGHSLVAVTNQSALKGFSGTDANGATDVFVASFEAVTVAPPVISIDSTDARHLEGNTGLTDFTFSIKRTGDVSGAASVHYAVTGAVDAADFNGVLPSGTVSFAANETSRTITLQVSGDTDAEAGEAFQVTLSNAVGGAIGSGVAAGVVINDDASPAVAGTVSINDVTITEGDAGAKTATFTVTRTAGAAAFDVTYATANGTATAGSDYGVIAPTVLSFAAGETSRTVSVSISGDTAFEADETFFVNLSNPTNGAGLIDVSGRGTAGSGLGTITNDDVAGTVSINDVTITEGDTGAKTATFTVTRTAGAAAFDVTYATANGTATAGSDYGVIAPTVLSFAAGETSRTVSVSISGDTAFEADETFFVNLSNPTNGAGLIDVSGRGTAGSGLGTITNDDVAGTVSINDVTITEGDTGAKTATFTVTRTAGAAAFDVTYATANGTATAGSDYGVIAPTVLSFAAGETSRTVSVSISGDTAFEADETFFVNLSNPTNGTGLIDVSGRGTAGSGLGTITNDDVAGTVSINDVTITEGDTGAKTATFTVTRTAGAAAFDVTYATANGTATVGSDYGAIAPTVLSFAAGETSRTVSVSISGDTAFEADETFFVNLSNPTNGAGLIDVSGRGTAGSGLGTITNDDVAGSVSIGDVSVIEGNGGTTVANITVTRIGGTAPFDVSYRTLDGTATAGSDYAGIAAGTLSFAAGETSKTISVTMNGDATFEPDEALSVVLTSATNNALLGDNSGRITIVNDDSATIPPIVGSNGSNLLNGTAGNDVIMPNAGADAVFARGGNDTIRATINDGNDHYDGGEGSDTADYSALTAPINANLDFLFGSGFVTGSQSGFDFLVSIENVVGSQAADTIRGSNAANRLEGAGGNDTMTGGGGSDAFVFRPGFGNDRITDFDANANGGQDFIELSGFGINAANFNAHVSIADVGADTLVTIDADIAQTIRLSGIGNASAITIDDFRLF